MFKKLLIHTRRSIKLIILISLAVLLILACIASFYKISYSVTINGEMVGYTDNKSKLQTEINDYIEKGESENTAFVQVENLPEYKVCLLKRDVQASDEDIFNTIKSAGTTYYRYYSINENDEEKLYLSTEKYKIGENNIKDYEDGDKYISRITKETKLKDYINNLKTNGEITVTKEDGTKLTEEEYVGTGMKLTVTKDKEKIELKIAVSGDLNGDGKVTATDLSTINQTILKTTKLENEYKLAADLDENNNITATDLSTLNKMLLKIL